MERKSASRKIRAANKEHQRTVSPRGRRANQMEAGHRRFKADSNPRKAVHLCDFLAQLGGQKWITRDIDFVSSAQNCVIDFSSAAIVEAKLQFFPGGLGGLDEVAWGYFDIFEAIDQPTRAGWSKRSLAECVLHAAREIFHGIR